jgi:hypothetical protein
LTTENNVRKNKKKVQEKEKQADGLLIKWLEIVTTITVNLSLGRLLEKIQPSLLDIYTLGYFH